jgi:hypothetical protein
VKGRSLLTADLSVLGKPIVSVSTLKFDPQDCRLALADLIGLCVAFRRA